MNMSRFSKLIAFAAAMLALVSCGSNARIDGTVADAASSEVIVKLLNSNRTDGFIYPIGIYSRFSDECLGINR